MQLQFKLAQLPIEILIGIEILILIVWKPLNVGQKKLIQNEILARFHIAKIGFKSAYKLKNNHFRIIQL